MAQLYLDSLQQLIASYCPPSAELICKHFFSGAALYAGGTICAILTPKGLAFKLPPDRCEVLLSQGRAVPLRYFERSPVKQGYVLFPDYDNLDDAKHNGFFEECLAYGRMERG